MKKQDEGKVVIMASENDSLKLTIERVKRLANQSGRSHVVYFGEDVRAVIEPEQNRRAGGLTAESVRNLSDDDLFLAYLEIDRRAKNGPTDLHSRIFKFQRSELAESMPELAAILSVVQDAFDNGRG